MTTLIVFICLALLLLIIVQISRVRDLSKQLRGREEVEKQSTASTGRGLLLFTAVFLIAASASALYYKNWMLGFGPLEAASIHGQAIDNITYWTLGVTYAAFILTHIFLFYYAYSYRQRAGHKAKYISHNNTVELLWTGIPAIVMTFLVVGGLDVWNETMDDVPLEEAYIEVEATGYQFAWQMRYPGPDGLLGRKDYRLITGANQLGIDWTDPKSHDDILVNDVTLPVDQKIRVRITAKDVLHDFYLPHFRVKMDAVPGLPTYFIFTPTKTTKEWRRDLSQYEEYQELDPDAQNGEMLWETRNFELACAELCGIGHWSMARTVTILNQDNFDKWYSEQSSYYEANIKGTDDDPLFMAEIKERNENFRAEVENALSTSSNDDNVITLENVTFESDSSVLTEESQYQLDNLISLLDGREKLAATLMGHTDNTGDAEANRILSESRARAVRDYLVEGGIDPERVDFTGYGADRPVTTNETEEGRSQNRRTELYIIEGGPSTPDTSDQNDTEALF